MLKIRFKKILVFICFFQIIQISYCKDLKCLQQEKTIIEFHSDSKINLSLWSVLTSNNVIPKEYPIEDIMKEKIVKDSANMIIGFYQLKLHVCLKDWVEDPIYNALFMISNDSLKIGRIVSSVYYDDFSFHMCRNNKYYFLDYSSPAGIYRYYIIDKESEELFLTDKMSEDEFVNLDLLSFDFVNLKFDLSTGEVLRIIKLK